ncbi:MAG: hypothetical protein FWG91_13645 [Lachnospiraceae bacterium]|nr:hypothetical protein [Lachnospiraceae bacterium]
MNENNKIEWMNDPLLKDIDKYKLEFLQTMVFESSNLSQNAMLPFLLAVMKRGQKKKLTFSDEEMETIITVLKKHSTADELEKINMVMNIRKTGNVPEMIKNHPMMKSFGK